MDISKDKWFILGILILGFLGLYILAYRDYGILVFFFIFVIIPLSILAMIHKLFKAGYIEIRMGKKDKKE